MKIPFSPPDMTEQEVDLVKEAILSGWITTGPKTKEFEKLNQKVENSQVFSLQMNENVDLNSLC